MTTPPRIAIIGAGPAGLTLARLLHVSQANLDIIVYEHDPSATSRPDQGGTLDLGFETGLAAIRQCDLWDEFQKYARYDGQEKIFYDKNATKLVHIGGGDSNAKKGGKLDRPEIDRQKLKELLLESLPSQIVKWGHHLEEVTKDGKLRFRDSDLMHGPFDLIVGADGAWSKVRNLLNDEKPLYSGISGFEMDIKNPSEDCPHVDTMVGRGSLFGSSDAKFLNAQRLGDDSIKVRAWFRCPEGEASRIVKDFGMEAAVEEALEMYSSWDPQMKEPFRHGDIDTLRTWTLYELPVGYRWEHQKGYTLIGDAASLATPFSGEGVNKAMKDAVELADLIARSQREEDSMTLDQAVLEYEARMFPRSEKYRRLTIENKNTAFGPTAPIGIMTNALRNMTRDSPSPTIRALGSFPIIAVLHSYLWTRMQIGRAVRYLRRA